jgi:hypothetical protein
MPRNTLRTAQTVGVACLVVLSALAGLPVVAADSTLTIDAHHPLGGEQAVGEFESAGEVSANTPQVDLTVTVAEDASAVGLDGPLRFSSGHTYLRLDYDEGVSRTVRLYLPAEMVTPRVKEDLEAANADVTADLRPTENRSYQAVTVRFTGETDVVFALSDSAGLVSQGRRWVKDKVGNATGVDLPTLGSGGQWQYIRPSEYGPNQSRAFSANESWVIQREAVRDGATVWLPVGECNDPASQPACTYTTTNQTVLMTTQEQPPRIRYKRGTDPLASLGAAVEDLLAIPGRIMDAVFGGG